MFRNNSEHQRLLYFAINRTTSLPGWPKRTERRNLSRPPLWLDRFSSRIRTQDQADSLLERLLVLHQETLAILDEARTGNAKDNALALRAIARAEKQLELQARLLGELQDGASVNIAVSPQWHVLRATVLQALIPYPEARVAVAEALTHDTQHQLNGN